MPASSFRFDPKHPFASKTIWVNLLTALIAVAAAMQGQDFIKENPLLTAGLVFGLAVLNAGLRFVTDAPIGFKAVLAAAVLWAGCSVAALAGDIAVIVPGTVGNYVLSVDAAGAVTLSPLDKVIRLVNPTPTPPNPPTPPAPLTDRAVQIRDAALKATGDADRATTAHGLAELYRQVAALVRQGKATDLPSLTTAIHTVTDTYMTSRGPAAVTAWQPMRDVFSNQWTLLTAKSNPPPTLPDFASLIEEAAAGLDASAPAASGVGITIPPQLMDFIIKVLLPLLIQLLQPHP